MRQITVLLNSRLLLSFFVLTWILPTTSPAYAQPETRSLQTQLADQPKYVGLTKCAACHFPQYKNWKSSPHGKAFELLPKKYKNDAECLKCHTSGFGQPTELADPETAYPMGVSCEACHGPGGEHAKIALTLVNQQITEGDLTRLRSAILKLDPTNACVKCHVSKAHKQHPEYEKDQSSASAASSRPTSNVYVHGGGSLFDSVFASMEQKARAAGEGHGQETH